MYFHSPLHKRKFYLEIGQNRKIKCFWLLGSLPTASASLFQPSSWPAFPFHIFWGQTHSYHFHSSFLSLLKIKLPETWNNFSEIPEHPFSAVLPASIFLTLSHSKYISNISDLGTSFSPCTSIFSVVMCFFIDKVLTKFSLKYSLTGSKLVNFSIVHINCVHITSLVG